MDDAGIISLFDKRNEEALTESFNKYGRYCHSIAFSVLYCDADAEECVNDAMNAAWNSIPPDSPENLGTYLGKITRNFAISIYRKNRAQKRAFPLETVFEEAEEMIPDTCSAHISDSAEIKNALDTFLAALPKKDRVVFIKRYWFFLPIKQIAKDTGSTESRVKVCLSRTRKKLRAFLEEEGIEI